MLVRDIEKIKDMILLHFDANKSSFISLESREGLILKNEDTIFKCLTLFNEQVKLINLGLKYVKNISPFLFKTHKNFIDSNQYVVHNFLQLKALSNDIKKYKPTYIINFEVHLFENIIIIEMPYIKNKAYYGGYSKKIIQLLREFKEMGWIATDLRPSNIKIIDDSNQNLIFLDIGYFFIPYYEELFKTMCRRAYLSMKFAKDPKIKNFLRYAINNKSFDYLSDSETHNKHFHKFYEKIIS